MTKVATHATPAAVTSATRHPAKYVTGATRAGARTQPMFPERPCMLYARATRRGLTVAFSIE